MSYYHSKVVMGDFEEVVTEVIAALKAEGFGVLTQIDVTQTLKDKINVDFQKYRILGRANLRLLIRHYRQKIKSVQCFLAM